MKRAAAILALLAIAAGLAWWATTSYNAAVQRADQAVATAATLRTQLDNAKAATVTVTQYVDRERVIRLKGDTIIKEVPRYVPVQADAACVLPRGFVRLHDAAAAGTVPNPDTGDADAAPLRRCALYRRRHRRSQLHRLPRRRRTTEQPAADAARSGRDHHWGARRAMMKPNSLREALTAAVPYLAAHPDALHVFVDEGNVVGTGGRSLGFEYRYTLTLIVTDYPDSSDTVVVPVLAWLRTNQPDALTNPDKREDAFKFEAEILNHTTADISIKLKLTERVTVKVDGKGYQVEHHPEPVNEYDDPATWRPA